MSSADQPSNVSELVDAVLALGGITTENQSNGSHARVVLTVEGLQIEIQRDYDQWLVNLGAGDSRNAPASFWVEAARSNVEIPVEVRGAESIDALIDVLPGVLDRLQDVAARVETIVLRYREEQRQRLEGGSPP